MSNRRMGLIILAAIFFTLGCSSTADDGQTTQSFCPCEAPLICVVDGTCQAAPEPQYDDGYAQFVLLRQYSPFTVGTMVNIAKAEVMIKTWGSKPQDERTKWALPDGGECAKEIDSNYPYYYQGNTWPEGKGLGADQVTFRPTGAPDPGMIVLEPLDLSPGWGYYHDEVPPALRDGAATYVDFFEPQHLPFGCAFSLELAGGPDVAATTIQGGAMAHSFQVSEPAIEVTGTTVPADKPLTIRWTPGQDDAQMEIFITKSYGQSTTVVTCTVPDDGETTIPVEVLNASVSGVIGLQMRRSVVRYAPNQTTLDGHPLHAYLIGRYAVVGQITLE